MAEILCRHFNGYKPCGLNDKCEKSCPKRSIPTVRVVLVHLGALGAVVRSTALLAAIHRKFPGVHLTWVTQSPADQLLKHNPLIDRIFTVSTEDLLALSCMEFDFALCLDKSLVACGLVKSLKAKKVFGFRAETITGSIIPATPAADELWEIGLSNQKKFFENTKPETQLSAEALELPYKRDEYFIPLNCEEIRKSEQRRQEWLNNKLAIVGLNTGCSPIIPYKKMSIESHRRLVQMILTAGFSPVLLGGKEDALRNQEIAKNLDVISSPTELGLRDGLVSTAACDMVITGDSLGMHMSIAMKKWVVAWFGPTCAHEIDLYGRGEHILSKSKCSPCWKRTCHESVMCYDLVDLSEFIQSLKKGYAWLTSSFTQHSSETSYSQSLPLEN